MNQKKKVLLKDDNFIVELTKQTTSSIGLQWELINGENLDFDIYKVEKCYSNNLNSWERVYWGRNTKFIIINLEQNLCFSFKITALKHEKDKFLIVKISSIFKSFTLPDIPSTLAIYRAVKKSQVQQIRNHLTVKPDLVNIPINGQSLLYIAVMNNSVEVTNALLELGAHVNVGIPANGTTPLHLAIYNKNLKIARLLIEHGADVQIKNSIGMNIIHYAVDSNDLQTLNFCLSPEIDVSIESKDRCGWTPLFRAIVMKADIIILKFLLDKKCNLRVKDNNKLSPLAYAKILNQSDVVRILENRLNKKSLCT